MTNGENGLLCIQEKAGRRSEPMRCFDTVLLRGGGLPFLDDEMRAGQKGGKGNGKERRGRH